MIERKWEQVNQDVREDGKTIFKCPTICDANRIVAMQHACIDAGIRPEDLSSFVEAVREQAKYFNAPLMEKAKSEKWKHLRDLCLKAAALLPEARKND